ncbi:MAG TPA: BON domain-containing protein [Blastocatellia bacterium]|nr:BON domain-containing protein [Blastocatellia bacterium]
MTRNRVALVTGVLLLTTLVAGCDTTTNTNGNNRNSNANANARATNGNSNSGVSREDFEKTKDSIARQAKDLGRKIGEGADDLWIWTKARTELATADDLRDSAINIDVENNVVTLSGSVPTEAQKAKAEQIARGIEGVNGVKNQIAVGPSAGNANNRNGR